MQFHECLAERAGVSEVSARHDDPIRHLPVESLKNPEHDRLLSFKAKRVQRIHQVHVEFLGTLDRAFHACVKVAGDLQRQRAIVERLGQLAERDLAFTDEDDRLHRFARIARVRGIDAHRGAGVTGRCACHPRAIQLSRDGKSGRHTVVFETAGRVEPFVLQEQAPRLHADLFGDLVGLLKDGATFADGGNFFDGREWQQLAEAPHAREVGSCLDGAARGRPASVERVERLGHGDLVPVVGDVEQVAALGAAEQRLTDVEGFATVGVDAFLIGGFTHALCVRDGGGFYQCRLIRHSRAGGSPGEAAFIVGFWIPAFAGMTAWRVGLMATEIIGRGSVGQGRLRRWPTEPMHSILGRPSAHGG